MAFVEGPLWQTKERNKRAFHKFIVVQYIPIECTTDVYADNLGPLYSY